MWFDIKNTWPQHLLAAVIISFAGWIYETLLFFVMYGGMYDRGFVTLPLCPIYGITVLAVYVLIGTPQRGGMLLNRMGSGGFRAVLYFVLAALIPAAAELVGGEIMERLTGEVLWSYEMFAMRLGKYVCLEISALWASASFFVMCFYEGFTALLGKMNRRILRRLALRICALVFMDFTVNLLLRA